MNDVFKGYGVPVGLPHTKTTEEYKALTPEDKKELHKDAFLKIRETLTRIGVPSRKEKSLYQSCHILHKRGEYAIVHFKELFALDGKMSNLTEEDIARRNRIALLLEEWGLLKISETFTDDRLAPFNHIKIIKYPEKHEWNLVPKYIVGNKQKKSS